MGRKLREIEALPEAEAGALLALNRPDMLTEDDLDESANATTPSPVTNQQRFGCVEMTAFKLGDCAYEKR